MIAPSTLRPPPANRLARFSVEQYHRMIASGAFTEDDRVELLAGWVVEKMAKNPTHSIVTGKLQHAIEAQLAASWHVRNQEPITLSDSEPEPDLAVVRGTHDDYAQSHPGPTDIAFVIEVADSTLRDDRWKQAIYARAGIAVSLIINLPDQNVELHTNPSTGGYRSQQVHQVDDEVLLSVEKSTIAFRLRDLLPPAS
jgi:Uma2 family endonuclease